VLAQTGIKILFSFSSTPEKLRNIHESSVWDCSVSVIIARSLSREVAEPRLLISRQLLPEFQRQTALELMNLLHYGGRGGRWG
jgi:hypothetical protein